MLTSDEALRRNPKMIEVVPIDLPFCYHVKPGTKKQSEQKVKVYYEFQIMTYRKPLPILPVDPEV